jgi:hypothetical protein
MPAHPPEGLLEETMGRSEHVLDDVLAPPIVNETKLHIIAVTGELDRPVLAAELCAFWSRSKSLSVFDYHLCTLVKAGVAEVVIGPELHFRLREPVESGHSKLSRERCRSACGTKRR